MSITVTHRILNDDAATGTNTIPDGESFTRDGHGCLIVLGAEDKQLAVYAPGYWLTAERHTEDPTDGPHLTFQCVMPIDIERVEDRLKLWLRDSLSVI